MGRLIIIDSSRLEFFLFDVSGPLALGGTYSNFPFLPLTSFDRILHMHIARACYSMFDCIMHIHMYSTYI